MASVAISALPSATSVTAADVTVVNQSGVTKQATLAMLGNVPTQNLTGVAGTNTVTGSLAFTPVYAIGQVFTLIPANTNTGPVTLNISGVGAGAVRLTGAALTGGEFVAGRAVSVVVTATTPVFEIIGSGPLPKSFDSGELGIAANTTYTAAHGFGAVPKIVTAIIRCKTAELGYSIGDEVQVYVTSNGSQQESPCVYADATNVGFVQDEQILIINRSTFTAANITLGNWKIVLRAYT